MPDDDIEVLDEAVVEVEVGDAGTTPQPEPVVEPVVAAPKPAPKVTPKTNAAADEAAAALSQAVEARKTAEEARKAAEATALSERRGREDAQRLAAQREQEAKSYKEQAENHELTIITSGIETASRELEGYEAEYARLMEAGEFAKASTINTRVAKAAAALDRLEDAKLSYESGARKQPVTTQEAAPQVAQSPFEQYVSTFQPQAQAWLRAHPDCVPSNVGGDATKNAKMMAGHYEALAKGIQPNTEDYFKTIEEHTGHRVVVTPAAPVSQAAEVIAAGTEPATPKPKAAPRQAQPSAPVTREPPAANGTVPTRTVRLTPAQQEIALLSASPREVQGPDGRVVRESDADFRRRAFNSYASELIKATEENKMGPGRAGRDIYG